MIPYKSSLLWTIGWLVMTILQSASSRSTHVASSKSKHQMFQKRAYEPGSQVYLPGKGEKAARPPTILQPITATKTLSLHQQTLVHLQRQIRKGGAYVSNTILDEEQTVSSSSPIGVIMITTEKSTEMGSEFHHKEKEGLDVPTVALLFAVCIKVVIVGVFARRAILRFNQRKRERRKKRALERLQKSQNELLHSYIRPCRVQEHKSHRNSVHYIATEDGTLPMVKTSKSCDAISIPSPKKPDNGKRYSLQPTHTSDIHKYATLWRSLDGLEHMSSDSRLYDMARRTSLDRLETEPLDEQSNLPQMTPRPWPYKSNGNLGTVSVPYRDIGSPPTKATFRNRSKSLFSPYKVKFFKEEERACLLQIHYESDADSSDLPNRCSANSLSQAYQEVYIRRQSSPTALSTASSPPTQSPVKFERLGSKSRCSNISSNSASVPLLSEDTEDELQQTRRSSTPTADWCQHQHISVPALFWCKPYSGSVQKVANTDL